MANIKCMNCMGNFDDRISSICPHCGYNKNYFQADFFALSSGTTLSDRYLFGNKISEDDTSISYIGWDNYNNRKVHIRELFPKSLCKRAPMSSVVDISPHTANMFAKAKKIFLNRGRLLLSASHEVADMAHVYDVMEENNTAYIVTEYIDGIRLSEVIQSQRLPWNSLKDIVVPVMNTLSSLHALGIVLASVTPDNIIITPNRTVKLVDFDCRNEEKVTASLSVNLRTSDFFSPVELFRSGTKITPAVDVYAFAAVIYYALTGICPAPSYDRAKNDNLVPPRNIGIDLDPNVENALLNALQVEAGERTPDAQHFAAELFGAKKISRGKSLKSKKNIIIVAVLAFVMLISSISIALLLTRKETHTTVELPNFPNKLIGLQRSDAVKKIEKWEKTVNEALAKEEKELKVTYDDNKQPVASSDSKYKNKTIIANVDPTPGYVFDKADLASTDYKIIITFTFYEYTANNQLLDDSIIVIPDFSQKTYKEMLKEQNNLKSKGINCSIETENNTIPKGMFIRQSIEADRYKYKDLKERLPFIVYISDGPNPPEETDNSSHTYKTDVTKRITPAPATTDPNISSTAMTEEFTGDSVEDQTYSGSFNALPQETSG